MKRLECDLSHLNFMRQRKQAYKYADHRKISETTMFKPEVMPKKFMINKRQL